MPATYRRTAGRSCQAASSRPTDTLRGAHRTREVARAGGERQPSGACQTGGAAGGGREQCQRFHALSAEFVEKRGAEWSDVHRRRFKQTMERDVSPDIGPLPVRDVTPAQILATLRKIEARGSLSVAALVRSQIGQVFRYAIATGKAETEPTWPFAVRSRRGPCNTTPRSRRPIFRRSLRHSARPGPLATSKSQCASWRPSSAAACLASLTCRRIAAAESRWIG